MASERRPPLLDCDCDCEADRDRDGGHSHSHSRSALHGLSGLLALIILTTVAPREAAAQQSRSKDKTSDATSEPTTKAQLEAQQHFQKAKELYHAGSYREAIGELEAARALDPKAKDLVFNLGIVHEKLGQFDEAIGFFRQYIAMENVTEAERTKAENIIVRVEGAKREVEATSPVDEEIPPSLPMHAPPPEVRHGRFDAAVIATGSLAIVGFAAGAGFGIVALNQKPGNNEFVTGRDGSYDALERRSNDAHTAAIIADIGLGVGVVSALASLYLYFSRTKEPKPVLAPTITAAPFTSGGGSWLFRGSFQ